MDHAALSGPMIVYSRSLVGKITACFALVGTPKQCLWRKVAEERNAARPG